MKNPTPAEREERDALRRSYQETANRMADDRHDDGPLAAARFIRSIARNEHEQYPQYEGHWDGDEWFLARCVTPVRTKLGVAAEPGDVVLAKRPMLWWASEVTFYSVRNGIDTSALGCFMPIGDAR